MNQALVSWENRLFPQRTVKLDEQPHGGVHRPITLRFPLKASRLRVAGWEYAGPL